MLASSAAAPAGAVNGTSPIKLVPRRARRTRQEMAALHDGLYQIVADEHPTTDRHAFYVAVARGLIQKTEQEYKNAVCRLILEMRRNGRLPHAWIADHTRWMRKPTTYVSLNAMLAYTAQTYRRALWADQGTYCEVWCEKDSVGGILYDATEEFDVPLMVARGFSSESFLFDAAEAIKDAAKPAHIYYFGDWDPSGLLIAEKIQQGLRRLAPGAEIHFQRVAVTREQISQLQLPTRPTKASSHSKRGFAGDSVELDALPSALLRSLARQCIAQHIDQEQLAELELAEESERTILQRIAAAVGEGAL